jgi:hypothetical protein
MAGYFNLEAFSFFALRLISELSGNIKTGIHHGAPISGVGIAGGSSGEHAIG